MYEYITSCLGNYNWTVEPSAYGCVAIYTEPRAKHTMLIRKEDLNGMRVTDDLYLKCYTNYMFGASTRSGLAEGTRTHISTLIQDLPSLNDAISSLNGSFKRCGFKVRL